MLQQTPVARVLPVYDTWMERWPTPASLAASPVGDAIRAWGRLGYPRRATRLHAAATVITEQHHGTVPDTYDTLRSLPGVGDYTASAVLAFAFGRRQPVLDTNVRRVLARVVTGAEFPPNAVTAAERSVALSLLPEDEPTAATWSVALMELGALVCTAAAPACASCPVRAGCAWRLAGHPAYDGPPRRGQAWEGTDRQCRGRLMALARDAEGSVACAGHGAGLAGAGAAHPLPCGTGRRRTAGAERRRLRPSRLSIPRSRGPGRLGEPSARRRRRRGP